ncbi:MAG: NAD-dependent epimerase/dehydratase family protein [Actinobacteria bacterium]|nr:MAG: NAD-dependent epimerase/dehydratase family protein [Actinomycetota bacterium]
MSGITVAVTGAAGFLGRALTPALRDDPAVDRVVAIDLQAGPAAHVDWRNADVRNPAIAEALRGADVVVHLAAVAAGAPMCSRRPRLRGAAASSTRRRSPRTGTASPAGS